MCLSTRRRDGGAELRVADDGTGMGPEEAARAQEPLFSGRGFGFGLGLPLVRDVVERHGGELAIESAPGRGTAVILRLPGQAPG